MRGARGGGRSGGGGGGSGHKGNKQYLPSKPCAACGREMTWRRAWARTWEQVRYCSDACRRRKAAAPG